MSVLELTDAAHVSQPVMSQHLKVLRDVGLVTASPEGTRNIYVLDARKLEEMRAFWIAHWSNLLASFDKQGEQGHLA